MLITYLVSCSNSKNITGINEDNVSIIIPKKDTNIAIKTPDDLINLSKDVASGRSYYKLTVILSNDIYLSSETDFTPIGTENNPFRGTFNGNGYTIKNMTIKEPHKYTGLIGYIKDGVIKNITVEDATISQNNNVNINTGSIAGYAYNSNIEFCTNKNGNITVKNIKGGLAIDLYAGGIVGRLLSTEKNYVRSCKSIDGIIKISSEIGIYVGGITGANYGYSISNCQNSVNMESTKNATIGGIVGFTTDDKSIVKDCKNYSDITGGNIVGGIIGFCHKDSTSILKKSDNAYTINILNSFTNVGTLEVLGGKKGELIGEAGIYNKSIDGVNLDGTIKFAP